MIYFENLSEFDSFDAKYKNVILKNNNIVIPYISLAVTNHPIGNFSSHLTYIDYCYLILLNVSALSVYIVNKRYKVIENKIEGHQRYYFGGDYLDFENSIFNDMEISCEKAYIQTLEFSKFSNIMWTCEVSAHNKSLESELTENFLNHKFLPKNIHQLTD